MPDTTPATDPVAAGTECPIEVVLYPDHFPCRLSRGHKGGHDYTSDPPATDPVTDDLLAALEFRYADPRVCRVCGAALQVGDSRGMKMSCSSDAASPYRNRYEAAGATWKEALDHWNESIMYDPPEGDKHIIALVREVRRLRALLGEGSTDAST
jgi:hypothetical protein